MSDFFKTFVVIFLFLQIAFGLGIFLGYVTWGIK